MKQRPILFSGPMVRAILEGRKTQTRRIVKPQPVFENKLGVAFWPDGMGPVDYRLCPYGQDGDRLWVKETFQTGEYAQNEPRGAVYRATDPDWETCEGWKWKPSIFMPRALSRITLEITGIRVQRLQDISEAAAMAEGIEQVGKTFVHDGKTKRRDQAGGVAGDPIMAFAELWDSINDKNPPRGEIRQGIHPHSWQGNPWVWVIEFQPLSVAPVQ
jgi:hypothetical protein